MRDEIVRHLNKYNFLRSSQHRCMAGKACLTSLLEYLEGLTSLWNKNHAVGIVYLDYAKAFDKVPHRRLLARYNGLGVKGRSLG